MARLLLSVAPLVKTISFASAPMAAAIDSRAASTASRASWPKAWTLCGLPYFSSKYGSIAVDDARIDARRGVVVHVDELVRSRWACEAKPQASERATSRQFYDEVGRAIPLAV